MKTKVPWLRAITVLALVLFTATSAMAYDNVTLKDFPEWVDGTEGQYRNYTQYVPQNASSAHAKAGDFGMAVAKVIAWWNFPSTANGTITYTDYLNKSSYEVNLAGTATGRPYDFSLMKVTLGDTNAAANQTTARLIADAAYAVETRFYANSTADFGSGTVLSDYFGFTVGSTILGSSASYSDAKAWTRAFQSELSANYTGRGKGAPPIIRLTPYYSTQNNFTQYNGSYIAVVTGWQNNSGDEMVRLNFASGQSRWTTLDNASYDKSANGSWAIKTFGYTKQSALIGSRPVYNSFYPISPATGEKSWWTEGPYVFGDAGGRSCDWYNVQVTNGSKTNTVKWVKAEDSCTDGVCTVYRPDYTISEPGNWTWAVSAWCSNTTKASGDPWWYQINKNYDGGTTYNAQKPDTPIIVTPITSYSTEETAPDFTWNVTRGCSWYRVKIYNKNGGELINAWFANKTVCGSSEISCTASWAALKSNSSKTATGDFPSGSFSWEVVGWGAGMSDTNSSSSLYNPGDVPQNVQNITVGPKASNGSVISAFPTISWNQTKDGSGLAYYDVWVGAPAYKATWKKKTIKSTSNYCDSENCTFKPWLPRIGDFQVWFQYWYNNTVAGKWQQSGWASQDFNASPGSPVAKGKSLPVEGEQILGFQPNFKWNMDQNASWMGISLYKDGSSSALGCNPSGKCDANGDRWIESGNLNTTYAWANSSVFQKDGLAGGTYTWKIRAWGPGNNTKPYPQFTMGTFKVTSNQPKAAQLSAPSNQSSQSGDVTFEWTGGNASWYAVKWTGPTNSKYWISEKSACGGVGGTTCTATVGSGNFTTSGNYTWIVRGWNPNVGSGSLIDSNSSLFTYTAN